MTRDEGGRGRDVESALLFEDAQHGEADRHQRRLCILGQRQVALRPLEDDARQFLTERLVDLLENPASADEACRKRAPHADRLRALPGKNEWATHAKAVARSKGRQLIVARPGMPSGRRSTNGPIAARV